MEGTSGMQVLKPCWGYSYRQPCQHLDIDIKYAPDPSDVMHPIHCSAAVATGIYVLSLSRIRPPRPRLSSVADPQAKRMAAG